MPARPSFLLDLPLRDLSGWWLRVECCGHARGLPLAFLARQKPAARLGDLLNKLRCRDCGARLAQVVLVDDPLACVGRRLGAAGHWQIEIVMPSSGGSAS
jgi:hypothetical protein